VEIKDVRRNRDISIGLGDIVTHKSRGGYFLVVRMPDCKEYPISLIDLITCTEENAYASLEDIKVFELLAKNDDFELVIGGEK
jgi:hypothetical protein